MKSCYCLNWKMNIESICKINECRFVKLIITVCWKIINFWIYHKTLPQSEWENSRCKTMLNVSERNGNYFMNFHRLCVSFNKVCLITFITQTYVNWIYLTTNQSVIEYRYRWVRISSEFNLSLSWELRKVNDTPIRR